MRAMSAKGGAEERPLSCHPCTRQPEELVSCRSFYPMGIIVPSFSRKTVFPSVRTSSVGRNSGGKPAHQASAVLFTVTVVDVEVPPLLSLINSEPSYWKPY